MARSTARRAAPSLLVTLACVLGGAASAPAATTTLQPSPAEARTFATTSGGWSSDVDYDGLVCIPGVTCPSATPSHQATGGAGGAGDGYLRNGFGTLLGVLSTTTIDWTSPTFVAPASTDTATLRFKLRPQIASLLAIGTVNVTATIVDEVDGARSTVVGSVPQAVASSSFAQISLDVPTSAVVAGRIYRVRIGTALTTTVSAVTSGTVDLDDVVLELVDAQPPTGLTATVPATGPTRVTGSVDAAGYDTDVTVDYGLTAAYGSTTAPVTVSGDTSGSQPFTVPLTGLTPGATYHYRVTATSADGTISTADATFVAPTPPSNAVPTVTGAGNAPTRTVTYARGADVTDAVIEVLDSGGTVLFGVPDANADGSVTITLPVDGDYGVRVVRSNAAGQSSTSDTVAVQLDRLAPDVSALSLVVAPAISSVTTRTVTFARPADAATITAQVIDAAGDPVGSPVTVTGGSATVTVGPADGAYRVRLTLADSTGNAANATSDPVELDTKGPDAGPAPVLTGTPDALTVAFQRAPDAVDATIEVRDADGALVLSVPVPSGNGATIALPAEIGAYAVRVVQADAAGNASATPSSDAERRADPGPDPGPGDDDGGSGGGGDQPAPPGNGGGTPTGGGSGNGSRTGGSGNGGGGTTNRPVCAKPVLLLTTVAQTGRRVRITGWTTRTTGTKVRISVLGGRRVGTAKVRSSGTFSVTVKAPATAAKRARVGYRAAVGRHRSPAVKLRRVNTLRTVKQSGTTVTLRGRVGTVRRLGRFTTVAAYGGTGDCPTINKRLATVGKPRINRRSGVYSLRVRVPAGAKHLLVKTRVTVGGGNYHSTHVVR